MRFVALAILIAFAFGLGGCASNVDTHSENEPVSTIPWNRPERWEGQGPFGGFAPGSY
jgi:hypothetical protein